ncbi:MAG TPA: helix-turn-helix domain-containing protein [Solirubrobacterales bacterium]|nr:helix-turn-helix domain-containing protein [Solirubrobacterales bacterium]
MASEPKTKPRRRTQEERRATTRAALLNATIDCLVEYGYANTTTSRVVERAGVSRGAQVHHFPTKAELVAEAMGYLAQLRADEVQRALERLPEGRERTLGALDLLWKVHTGPLFAASLELWVAARTDRELREQLLPVEREINARLLEGAQTFFGVADDEALAGRAATALAAIRGLAMAAQLLQPPRQGIDAQWRALREQLAELIAAD